MEYIEITTDKGKLTGKTATRDEIHKLGLWHRTVHIWLVNGSREILLQKRALTKKANPGLWDISCAGHISAGETPVEAAIKELREELGMEADKNDLEFLFTLKSESIHMKGSYIDREINCTWLIKKNIPLSDFKIQKGEIESIKYLPLQEFKQKVIEKSPELAPHEEEYLRLIEVIC